MTQARTLGSLSRRKMRRSFIPIQSIYGKEGMRVGCIDEVRRKRRSEALMHARADAWPCTKYFHRPSRRRK